MKGFLAEFQDELYQEWSLQEFLEELGFRNVSENFERLSETQEAFCNPLVLDQRCFLSPPYAHRAERNRVTDMYNS